MCLSGLGSADSRSRRYWCDGRAAGGQATAVCAVARSSLAARRCARGLRAARGYNYVKSSDDHTYFKVPDDWKLYDNDALLDAASRT